MNKRTAILAGVVLGTSALYSQGFTTNPFISSAYAATDSQEVDDINVTGNKRIETSTVLSFLKINTGDDVSSTDLDAALNRIYDSGLFADVKLTVEGDVLQVKLRENPIISEIAFEGNQRINDDELLSELNLGPRAIYSKSAVQQDIRRILSLYQRKGRFAAQVIPKIIPLDDNRINLVFEVEEGEKSKTARVLFVGNEAFSDSRLSRVVATKESRWYRFLSNAGNYDPDRLEFDKELLRRFYVENGYADFAVVSAGAELTPDKKDFFVQYTVTEGIRYRNGTIDIESRIADVSSDELAGLVGTKTDDWFNATTVDNTITKISEFLGDKGYAFVEIVPRYTPNAETGIMAINYVVKEGPRVYVENININGNVRTLDEVIRREFNVAEGDPYNASQINRSKQKIERLGFFKTTSVEKSRGSADDKVNIDVDVEEQSTGELTFGAGFSTTDGALGDIGLTERNLLGRGQFLRLNFTLAASRQEVDFSFTEPYFLGRDFAAGIDIFSSKTEGGNSVNNRTFDNDALGFTLRGTYALTDYLDHTVRYSLRNDDISNVDANASQIIQRQVGENSTSLIGHSLLLDKRNSRFDATEGYFLRFNQDFAGIGGDAKFIRHEVQSGYYHPLLEDNKLVLRLTGSAGNVFAYEDEVRINDRFFVGSQQIRGFDNEGIGPRDEATSDPLGGNSYAVVSAELGFPVGLPEELGVTGAVFADAGTLFDSDDIATAGSQLFDEASPRVSVGVGFGWNSPFGPTRIDFAAPIVKEDFDETENIRFNFGTRF